MSLRSLLFLSAGLVLGCVLSFAIRPPTASQGDSALAPVASPSAGSREIDALRAELANERVRLSEAERVIAALDSRWTDSVRQRHAGLTESEVSGRSDKLDDSAPALQSPDPDKGELFNRRALQRLGVSPREIERIHDRWDVYSMEILATLDEVQRGLRTRVDYVGMEQALRQDLGEDAYDAMLYATGKPNRVRVSRVLDPSPAAQAGLRAGDVVLSYDGIRVFKPMMLSNFTRGGRAGELVDLRVQRDDGEVERLFIERGAMGATTVAATRAPRVRL